MDGWAGTKMHGGEGKASLFPWVYERIMDVWIGYLASGCLGRHDLKPSLKFKDWSLG